MNPKLISGISTAAIVALAILLMSLNIFAYEPPDGSIMLHEGSQIQVGPLTFDTLETPGHTPGGLSFIFPVHDNGVEHMAGMWGGTNPPATIEGNVQYLSSIEHFAKETAKYHCDVPICNHPDFDNGYLKMEYARNRKAHMPNCYCIGESEFQRFNDIFKCLAYGKLRAIDASANH